MSQPVCHHSTPSYKGHECVSSLKYCKNSFLFQRSPSCRSLGLYILIACRARSCGQTLHHLEPHWLYANSSRAHENRARVSRPSFPRAGDGIHPVLCSSGWRMWIRMIIILWRSIIIITYPVCHDDEVHQPWVYVEGTTSCEKCVVTPVVLIECVTVGTHMCHSVILNNYCSWNCYNFERSVQLKKFQVMGHTVWMCWWICTWLNLAYEVMNHVTWSWVSNNSNK